MIDLSPDVVTIAVSREDGGLTILKVITAEYQLDDAGGKIRTSHREPTEAHINALIAKRYEPIPGYPNGIWHSGNGKKATTWRIVPNDFVTDDTDRTYRNAWKDTLGKGSPDHDMEKAKNIHRDVLRKARTSLMDELDVEYQRADEAGDTQKKKDVAARKQTLRDLTNDPRIDAATTIDDLKRIQVTAT